jgi:hypothetical protein
MYSTVLNGMIQSYCFELDYEVRKLVYKKRSWPILNLHPVTWKKSKKLLGLLTLSYFVRCALLNLSPVKRDEDELYSNIITDYCLQMILELVGRKGVDWIHLALNWYQWQAV